MQNILFKNIFVLMIIGLLIALTAVNGLNFYNLVTKSSEDIQIQTKMPLVSQSQKIASSQAIVQWHLFGKNTIQQTSVPKTTLRIKLIGIISSTSDGQARIIIEGPSRKQEYYKVGDKIKNNVTVKSIHPDHIVIMHNSREEIVPLRALNTQKNLIKKVVIQ